MHDDDHVGHRQGLFLVVGHVDERDPDLLLERLQLELHLLAKLQVERAERLVEEQDGRPVDEGPGQRDALLLPAGQLPGPASLVAREPDQLERLARSPPLLLLLIALLAQAVADVLGDVHVREQRVVLEDGVDAAPVRRDAGDRPAGEEDLALGRLLEASDHAERRRLAAARRPEQARERTARDPERHRVDGDDLAEPLRDLEQLDIRGALGQPGGWCGAATVLGRSAAARRRSRALFAAGESCSMWSRM